MIIKNIKILNDIRDVVDVWFQEWGDDYKSDAMTDTQVTYMLFECISNNELIILGMYEGSTLVNCCGINIRDRELFNLVTVPLYRQCGYTTRMIRHILQEMNIWGIYELYTIVPNQFSHWFDKKFSFKKVKSMYIKQQLVSVMKIKTNTIADQLKLFK